MLKLVAEVCSVILVITYFSEQCNALEINFEHVENNDLRDYDLSAPETINYVGKIYEEPLTETPQQPERGLFQLLFGEKGYENNKLENEPRSDDLKKVARSRVVRQAYHAPTSLYPQLPSNQPYNPYNNQQNTQWKPHNNYSQPGYPSNGVSNFHPSAQNSSYGHNPYNPSQSQTPYYNNSLSAPPYSGYKPPNSTIYSPGSGIPPYNQQGQHNNPYSGYPTTTPGYRPGNNVTPYNPYKPGQVSPYSPTTPSNGYPGIYNSNRPPYNNNNASYWPGGTGPNARPGYNASNAQYFNSNPTPYYPYGQPNSNFSHNVPNQGPYQNPTNGGHYPTNNNNAGPYGQNPQSSYPQGPNQNSYNNPYNGQYGGNPQGSNTFNPTNGYNPANPNHPPYSSALAPYPPGSDRAHDPTRVSPQNFSYPH